MQPLLRNLSTLFAGYLLTKGVDGDTANALFGGLVAAGTVAWSYVARNVAIKNELAKYGITL
jgi:hypothetical protein